MLTDNRFTADSITVHVERLTLMQQNFTAHSSEFAQMKPEPLLWALTCHTHYQEKRYTVSHQMAVKKAAIMAAQLAFKVLKQDYFGVRDFARQFFAGDSKEISAYKLNIPYPAKQYSQLELVSSLLKEHANRAAANEHNLLPATFIVRLTQSFDVAKLALNEKSNALTETNHARLALIAQRKADIQNLKLFVTFASAIWKADDIRFNDIGFARPEQVSLNSKVGLPKIPTDIGFNGSTTLEWTAVPGATSYGISTSDDGEEWTSDDTAQTNSATVRTELQGKVFYKVRARNARGLGEYSKTFERLFGLESVSDFVYDLGQLSWEEVEFAKQYEVERAPAGTSVFARIYTGSDTIARDTPPSGNWTYRVRGTNGSVKGEWVEEVVSR